MKKQIRIEQKKKQEELNNQFRELAKVIQALKLNDLYLKKILHLHKDEEHLKLKHADRLTGIIKEMEQLINGEAILPQVISSHLKKEEK